MPGKWHQNRSPEALERKRVYNKEYSRKRRLDPEFRAKANEAQLLRRSKAKEYYNEMQRVYRAKNKEAIDERRREWRKSNPSLARKQDKEWRDRTLRSHIARFGKGEITLDCLTRRLRRAFIQDDEPKN